MKSFLNLQYFLAMWGGGGGGGGGGGVFLIGLSDTFLSEYDYLAFLYACKVLY